MKYAIVLNVPDNHLGETCWMNFIARYSAVALSAPEMDDEDLGKGQRAEIISNTPLTLEGLTDDFWNLTFRELKEVA